MPKIITEVKAETKLNWLKWQLELIIAKAAMMAYSSFNELESFDLRPLREAYYTINSILSDYDNSYRTVVRFETAISYFNDDLLQKTFEEIKERGL